MNAMTALFPLFLLVLGWQLYSRSPHLFATWAFLYCLLPTYVFRIGALSLYWCDLSAIAVLLYWYNDQVPRRSASLAVQWFKVLIVTLGIGLLSSLVRYGAIFEPLYWVIRYAFALATLPIITAYSRQPALRQAILSGVMAAAVGMFLIAVTQQFRLPFNEWLDHVLYDGYTSDRSSRTRALYFASDGPMRVFGPYCTSTQFGGAGVCVGVLLAVLSWTSKRPQLLVGRQRLITIATVLAWASALMTFSRHALLAILAFLVVTAAADLRKSKWVWALSAGAIISVGSGYFGSFVDFWLERIGKGGIGTDANLAYRLQTRPYELLDRIMTEPSVLYGGVGLGSEHILSGAQYGFVSNGFLLYLFYCGLPAFLAFLGCFAYAFRRSLAQPRDDLPAVVPASVLAMAIVVAADNYAYFTTNLVFMWAVAIGLSFMPPVAKAQKPGGTGSPRTPLPARWAPRVQPQP